MSILWPDYNPEVRYVGSCQRDKFMQTVKVRFSEVATGTNGDCETDIDKKFNQYNCFYCDTRIEHQKEVEVHNMSCHRYDISTL